jgi:hypothetical protein
MAQRWLDLANAEYNPAEPDDKTIYNLMILAKIGQGLQLHFQLPDQLRHQMSALLMQFDNTRRGGIR